MSPRKIDLPEGPPPPSSRSMVSGRRKKQGHSHRWCETCRLYVEWMRFARKPTGLYPFLEGAGFLDGLYRFLWAEYRSHRGIR